MLKFSSLFQTTFIINSFLYFKINASQLGLQINFAKNIYQKDPKKFCTKNIYAKLTIFIKIIS